MRIRLKDNFVTILIFIFIAIISNVILLHLHVLFFGAGDFQFHLRRIMELKSQFYHGNVLFTGSVNYFHGSAVMNMYPYYSVIPLFLISSFISSYITSYHLFFILIVFLALINSFYGSLFFSRCRNISYIFSILYGSSMAIFMDAFYDGDLGLTTSLVFLPIAIFGFLDVLKSGKHYVKLAIGIFLMFLCQLPAAIILFSFLFVWVLINIKDINKLIAKSLLKALILLFLLMSVVLIPIFKISLFNNINTPNAKNIQESGLISIVKNVGIIPFLCLFILLLYIKHFNKMLKQMYWLSLLIIICSSKLFPLNLITSVRPIKFVNNFQFTARFLIIPNILLCYLSACLVYKMLNKKHNKRLFMVITTILIVLIDIMGQIYLISKDLHSNEIANNYRIIKTTHAKINRPYLVNNKDVIYFYNGYLDNNDYYPRSSNIITRFINNNDVLNVNNKVISKFKHVGYNKFVFNIKEKTKNIKLPILLYNNEKYRLYLNSHPINYCTNNNTIIINKARYGKNKLYIKNVHNYLYEIVQYILFIIGLIWILCHLINVIRSKNNRSMIKNV